MRRIMTRLAVLSVAGLSVAGLAATGTAGAATPRVGAHVVGFAHSAATAPNSNIVGTGSKAKFDPTSLKVKQYTKAKCSASTPAVSLSITNTGTKAAELYEPGVGPVYSIPASGGVDVCLYGGKKGTTGELFGLSNASGSKVYKAKLDVTLTNS